MSPEMIRRDKTCPPRPIKAKKRKRGKVNDSSNSAITVLAAVSAARFFAPFPNWVAALLVQQ